METNHPVRVVLSSTFRDLEKRRQQVLNLMRRHEFHDIAMESDAALPMLDNIEASPRKVDQAESDIASSVIATERVNSFKRAPLKACR